MYSQYIIEEKTMRKDISIPDDMFILDTSVFVNPASAHQFGPNPTQAFHSFLKMAKEIPDVQFYMPPKIYSELMYFAEESKIPVDLLMVIKKQPPRKFEVKIPGIFIYSLVESMRDRIDRGLRLSERHVREALEKEPPKKEDRKNSARIREDAEIISRLRESYRRIMREGLLDSKADVDLLLLAYELKANLVSADQGVLDWANDLGIKIFSYDHLLPFLKDRQKNAS